MLRSLGTRQLSRQIITSDVQQQIMMLNQNAMAEWVKQQAETDKFQKPSEADAVLFSDMIIYNALKICREELIMHANALKDIRLGMLYHLFINILFVKYLWVQPESETAVHGGKEKDDSREKVNKEEDGKMRTTATNVAAWAADGGDEVLSKWQLMAEQVRQKREGGMDAASGSQAGKNVNRRPLSACGKNSKDNQVAEKRGPLSPLAPDKLGSGQDLVNFDLMRLTG